MDSASAVLPFELWEGQIPAAVTLCSDDVTALTTPDPIYVMIPRMGYLANVVNTVIECFQDSVTQYGSQNNVWFACEGQPLNWQLPAGVLYDMFCDSSAARDANLPWKLTVHFQAFPSEMLVPCSGDKAFEQHYFHSLKQGLYLEHGNSSTAMSLELQEQQQLWESVLSVDPSSFHAVDKRLRRAGGGDPVAIPVRIVLAAAATGGGDTTSVTTILQPFCKLEKPALEANTGTSGGGADREGGGIGSSITVGEFLRQHCAVMVSGDPPPPPLSASEQEEAGACVDSNLSAIAHCVALPLNASLVEVWSLLAHPDHFLYLTVRI